MTFLVDGLRVEPGPLKIANQRKDFQRLTSFLQDQDLPVRVALEATADFHRAIAHWLLRHGFEVHLASSIAGARVREVLLQLLGQA